ncbi:MAG: hypothetical protein RIB60_07955 [Phycisphaerales bacterium]
MPKLCPKIILEGTRLTHKTDLAFALNEHPDVVGERKYRYHSPVVSGEWCGFTNTPWGRGLINFGPVELEHALAAYDAWLNLIEHLPFYSWIIDRFHVSTLAHQRHEAALGTEQLAVLESHLEQTEARLHALGFRLVLCVREPASFQAARAERLKVSGNPSQYDDLSRFVGEQERLRSIVERSTLGTLVVDVSDDDVASAANRVADWLKRTGGLHAPADLTLPGR